MSFENTFNTIKKFYESPCNPNLTKYMKELGEEEDYPDECNCYLHSYDIKDKSKEYNDYNIDLLKDFIKFVDKMRKDIHQLTFLEIKELARDYEDDTISFKNANF